MAGKKGKSGPPGNLNGAHFTWRAFWRRRALDADSKWITPILEEYRDGIVRDAGGEGNASNARLRAVEIAQTARGAAMLILAEAKKSGFIRQTPDGWDLSPGVKELAKFLNVERQALQAIGFEKAEPKDIDIDMLKKQMREEEDKE